MREEASWVHLINIDLQSFIFIKEGSVHKRISFSNDNTQHVSRKLS